MGEIEGCENPGGAILTDGDVEGAGVDRLGGCLMAEVGDDQILRSKGRLEEVEVADFEGLNIEAYESVLGMVGSFEESSEDERVVFVAAAVDDDDVKSSSSSVRFKYISVSLLH